MNNTPRNIVLNSYSATPFSVEDGILYAGDERVCAWKGIMSGSVQKYVAATEQLAEWTITPAVPVSGAPVGIEVTQWYPTTQNNFENPKVRTLIVDVPAGGYTAEQLCNAFRAQYFATGTNQFEITASGTSTLILTANAGYPIVFVRFVAITAGNTATVVNGTAGINARGNAAQLIANGVPAATASGTAYTLYTFGYTEKTGLNNSVSVSQPDRVWIWLNQADSDYAAAIISIDTLLAGLASGVANPEIIAVYTS